MNHKVSIIIPVYNIGRQLLSKCIYSCIYQSYSNIEIVLVNDCSPNPEDDATIVAFTHKFHEKVKVVSHPYNQRQGAARNTGVENCTGDYIVFVDADDYIDSVLCERLVKALNKNDYDVVYCKKYRYCSYEKSTEQEWFKNIDINRLFGNNVTPSVKIHELVKQRASGFMTGVCGTLIKKKYLLKNNIKFTGEKVEDRVYAFKLILFSNKICLIDACLYNYVQRDYSDSYFNLLDTHMEWQKALIQFLSNCKLYDNNKTYIDLYILIYFYNQLHHAFYKRDLLSAKEYAFGIERFISEYNLDFENINKTTWMKFANLFHDFIQQKEFARNNFMDFFYNVYVKMYICDNSDALQEFEAFIHESTKRPICIWGAGHNGNIIARLLNEYTNLSYEITDINTKIHGTHVCNHIVKPWSSICNGIDCVVVCSSEFVEQVAQTVGDGYRVIDYAGCIRNINKRRLVDNEPTH